MGNKTILKKSCRGVRKILKYLEMIRCNETLTLRVKVGFFPGAHPSKTKIINQSLFNHFFIYYTRLQLFIFLR